MHPDIQYLAEVFEVDSDPTKAINELMKHMEEIYGKEYFKKEVSSLGKIIGVIDRLYFPLNEGSQEKAKFGNWFAEATAKMEHIQKKYEDSGKDLFMINDNSYLHKASHESEHPSPSRSTSVDANDDEFFQYSRYKLLKHFNEMAETCDINTLTASDLELYENNPAIIELFLSRFYDLVPRESDTKQVEELRRLYFLHILILQEKTKEYRLKAIYARHLALLIDADSGFLRLSHLLTCALAL